MIRHCPRCELRFVTEGELREHLEVDHGTSGEAFERFRYPAGPHAQEPLYRDLREEPPRERRRYLVVANQSLAGETLALRLRELAAGQPSSFYVVVPATHSSDYASERAARRTADRSQSIDYETDESGRAQAAWRLRRALAYLHGLGVEASGEVGHADPLEAVARVLQREPIDEVIVSTLPSALSRWLAADVPSLLARRFGLPVITVVAAQEPAT